MTRTDEEVRAYLLLQKTAAELEYEFAELMKRFGLTPNQYNVLRILRGAGPAGLPCGEVSFRMVTPVPDVTRLLDRLVSMKLATRERSETDRRVVITRIARRGTDLLRELAEPVAAMHRAQLGHLKRDELAEFTRHLERVRERAW